MPPNFIDFTKTNKGLIIDIFFFSIKDGKLTWTKVFTTTLSSFKKPSETVYTIGLLPLGGYVKMKGILDENMDSDFKGADDELESKNPLQKIWVMSAGVIMNLILTFFVFAMIGNIQGDSVTENNNTVIDYVVPEQPAEISGMLAGDKILSINNIKVDSWESTVENIEKNPNKTVPISLEREGEIISLSVSLGSKPNFCLLYTSPSPRDLP